MLGFLFRRLTDEPKRGQALFDRIIAESRQPHWFVEGQVPDTIDGRFAVLATVTALVTVRIEASGEGSAEQSAALTERFIETMDAEHREIGLNDPGLGRRVRKLLSSLGRRVETWRAAVAEGDWSDAVRSSVYRGQQPDSGALAHTEARLRQLWTHLSEAPNNALLEGRF